MNSADQNSSLQERSNTLEEIVSENGAYIRQLEHTINQLLSENQQLRQTIENYRGRRLSKRFSRLRLKFKRIFNR